MAINYDDDNYLIIDDLVDADFENLSDDDLEYIEKVITSKDYEDMSNVEKHIYDTYINTSEEEEEEEQGVESMPVNAGTGTTVLRHKILDLLDISTTATPNIVKMGEGFTALDETFGAQIDTKQYISDATSSSTIKSYTTVFPFTTDFVFDDDAVDYLYKVGRNHETGSDAEADYYRVDYYETAVTPQAGGEAYPARKFRVAIEATSAAGNGGEAVVVTGNLNSIGDPTEGWITITTDATTLAKTYTWSTTQPA